MSEIFTRVEKKYLLNNEQYQCLIEKLKPFVHNDNHSDYDISTIYYDTDNLRLLRRSIEKPDFKEKLRIRSYGVPSINDDIYVEIKRKLNGVVYKRRTKAKYQETLKDIYHTKFENEQIGNEINYFISCYGKLKPVYYVGCNRHSYIGNEDNSIRITFDRNIRYRNTGLYLGPSDSDKSLTDYVVMEIKVKETMPLWLTNILDKAHAYPRGFSKVGNAFEKELLNYESIL